MDRVSDVLRSGGRPVEVVRTQQRGDAESAARRQREEGTLLVAFGGDGTFNEVINGADLEGCTLGLIPGGTGNVLGRELRLSFNPVRAAEELLSARTVEMDLGRCNGRLFACVFGAGLDAWVVQRVHERRGPRMARWRYVPHVARVLWTGRDWRISVTVDGRPFAGGMRQVAIGNTHTYGPPLELTSAASPTDGLLDVMCAPLAGPLEVARVVVHAALRSTQRCRCACYGRGRSFTVTAEGDGVPYQIDGEAAGYLPAEVEVLPAAARIAVPARRATSPDVVLGRSDD